MKIFMTLQRCFHSGPNRKCRCNSVITSVFFVHLLQLLNHPDNIQRNSYIASCTCSVWDRNIDRGPKNVEHQNFHIVHFFVHPSTVRYFSWKYLNFKGKKIYTKAGFLQRHPYWIFGTPGFGATFYAKKHYFWPFSPTFFGPYFIKTQ